jgi:predicted nucleotidyltransferase
VTTQGGPDDPVVRIALRAILACVEPHSVLLFGSRSRSQASAHSDLDLIVVADVGHRQRRLARELREMLGGLAMPVDVLLRTPAELDASAAEPFLRSVRPSATVVYGVDPEKRRKRRRR